MTATTYDDTSLDPGTEGTDLRLANQGQQDAIHSLEEVIDQIADLLDILSKPERINQIIKDELVSIGNEFSDERRSMIEFNATELGTEDLITPSPEAHSLLTARVAKVLLDHGFTSAWGASEAKLRLGVDPRSAEDRRDPGGPRRDRHERQARGSRPA